MVLKDEWETGLALDDDGKNVVVTRRIGVDNFRLSGKLPYRIEVIYNYLPDSQGMPRESEEKPIGDLEGALRPAVEKDKLAILTGNYLGGGRKYMVFYARNVEVFFERLNEALDPLPELPLSFECEEDPEWEEYTLMGELLR